LETRAFESEATLHMVLVDLTDAQEAKDCFVVELSFSQARRVILAV
jgi:hypothetical protein